MTIFFVNILCETSGFEEKSFQKSSHVILPLFSTCANGEAGGAVFTLNWHSRILYFYLILPKKVQFWSISVFQHFAYPNFSQIKVMKLVVFFMLTHFRLNENCSSTGSGTHTISGRKELGIYKYLSIIDVENIFNQKLFYL